MKQLLPLLAFLLLNTSLISFASHDIGGEISYKQLSPNNYEVTYRYYRDCLGAPADLSMQLSVKAPGCNTGRTVTLNQVFGNEAHTVRPYGPAITVNCSATSRSIYEIKTYRGLVTFSAAEQTCPDWIFSIKTNARGTTENTLGQTSLYTEARLKLLPNLVNHSPQFDTLHAPVIYAPYGLLNNLSMAALDPDGDSLVYTLVAPLEDYNDPVSYQPNTQGSAANLIMNPNPKPPYNSSPFGLAQYAILPTNYPATFSPTYPMPSLFVNWDGPPTYPYPGAPTNGMIWEANPTFALNPVQGDLKFSPSVYYPGTPSTAGRNKYLVSVMVDEFRKVNGVMTKLGTVRRETMIEVMDNGGAGSPSVPDITANNVPLTPGFEIQLRPGATLNLQFASADFGASTVFASTNATYILPGATFASTTGNQINGSVSWTPTAADVRWQPYYFQIMVKNDANPLRAVQTATVAVRVNASGGVTGVKNSELSATTFSAYPNPFSQDLTFRFNLKTKAESIVIYNLLGQQIDQISLANAEVGEKNIPWRNAAKYAAGTYVAKLISDNKNAQTLKFTKVH